MQVCVYGLLFLLLAVSHWLRSLIALLNGSDETVLSVLGGTRSFLTSFVMVVVCFFKIPLTGLWKFFLFLERPETFYYEWVLDFSEAFLSVDMIIWFFFVIC